MGSLQVCVCRVRRAKSRGASARPEREHLPRPAPEGKHGWPISRLWSLHLLGRVDTDCASSDRSFRSVLTFLV